MATLTINGRKVTVDDRFRSLSPEQQEATVEEIAGSLGISGSENSLKQDGSLNADNAVRALGTGVPVLGGLLNRFDAATNATLAPLVDPLLPDSFQKLHGDSWNERYDQALNIQQGKDEAFQSEHPYVNTGLQLAGGIGAMAPAIAAAPALFGAGNGSLLTSSLAGAGSGAAIGGLDAGVRSDFDPKAVQSGITWGGGFGLFAPAVGRTAGKAVEKVAGRFRSPSAAQQRVTSAMAADGVDDVAARLSQMGPDAMPMDLGPNLQAQAAALAGTPGRAQETIRTAIAQRQAGAGQRVMTALDDALGQTVDTIALADDIIARRSAAARPLYEAAYSKPVPFTKDMEELLQRPTVGKALKKAQALAADEGMTSRQWFANVANDGKSHCRTFQTFASLI